MNIEWLPVAERDRESQFAYLADRNALAAISIGDATEAAVSRLADLPYSGRPGRVAGTRELVVTRTPYVIAWRVERNRVLILRLLLGAQRWPSRL